MSFIAIHLFGVLARAGICLPLLFLSGALTYNKPRAMTTRKPWVKAMGCHGGVQTQTVLIEIAIAIEIGIGIQNDFASPCDCVILSEMTFDFDHDSDFDTDSVTRM
jgi:hypothetical protein